MEFFLEQSRCTLTRQPAGLDVRAELKQTRPMTPTPITRQGMPDGRGFG